MLNKVSRGDKKLTGYKSTPVLIAGLEVKMINTTSQTPMECLRIKY